MSEPFTRINSWDDIPHAIARLQLAGPDTVGRVLLLQALLRGGLAHIELQRSTPAAHVKRFLSIVKRPALILIGDDDDLPTGPAGWKQATRLLKWARYVVIHGARQMGPEYQAAIGMAYLTGRVLFIETSSAHIVAWEDAVRSAPNNPAVLMLVPDGGVHPVAMPREKMQ